MMLTGKRAAVLDQDHFIEEGQRNHCCHFFMQDVKHRALDIQTVRMNGQQHLIVVVSPGAGPEPSALPDPMRCHNLSSAFYMCPEGLLYRHVADASRNRQVQELCMQSLQPQNEWSLAWYAAKAMETWGLQCLADMSIGLAMRGWGATA